MLSDALIGKSVATALDSKTQKATIVAAVEIGSSREISDRLDKLKRTLTVPSNGSLLVVAIRV